MKNTLLLFSEKYPCWDSETIKLAGENPDVLEDLEKSGYLLQLGSCYVITQKGIIEREKVSNENFVPSEKIEQIITDENIAKSNLEVNRMVQLLDRAFMTQWGIKEFNVNEIFPLVPYLKDDEYFSFEGKRVKAIWRENKFVESLIAKFPNSGYEARKMPAPGYEALRSWSEENNVPCEKFQVDFVLRHRHDFEHYRQMKTPANDVFGFVNSSLVFAHKVRGNFENLLPLIGKLHIFFMMQRRIYLPGWFDMDSEDQETLKVLTLVTDTDSELRELARTLRKWGTDLNEPARPLFITGTSIEHLRKHETKSMFYDWFAEETIKILRPDFQDNI